MTAQSTETSAGLLAAIAEPAVLVDEGGRVVAWNAAAKASFGIAEDAAGLTLEAIAGERAASGQRVRLADPAAGDLIVWSLDEHGLGPDEAALQKLDTLERVSGGILHAERGRFTAILGFAELIAADPGVPPDLRETAGQLTGAAMSALQMIQTMLEYIRPGDPAPQLVSVGPLVRGLVDLLTHATFNMHPRITVPDSLMQVEANPAALRQAVLGLLLNAIEAQGGSWGHGAQQVDGRLIVSGRELDDEGGHRLRLAIEDGGPVVPIRERHTLFAGTGTARAGRDLSIVRALVEEAGGRVSYERVANGNRIVVELPEPGATLPPLPEPDDAADEAEPPLPVPPLILVCDDLPLIRTLLVRFVNRMGVRAVEARDAREALGIVGEQPVTMVIADLGLEDGANLYEAILDLRPDLASRFVLMSADPGSPKTLALVARTGVPLLPKPFDNARLEQLVRDAIGG